MQPAPDARLGDAATAPETGVEAVAPMLTDAERPLGVPRSMQTATTESASAPSQGVGLGDVLQTIGPLAGVLVLIAGFAWITRKVAKNGGVAGRLGAGGRAPSGVVEVLARYPVGRGQVMALIKIGPRVLVTCQTHGRGGSMTTLSEITDPDEIAMLVMKTAEQSGAGMASAFRSAIAREDARIATEVEAKPVRRVNVSPEGDRVELLTSGPLTTEPQGPTAEGDPFDGLRGRLEDWRRRAAG